MCNFCRRADNAQEYLINTAGKYGLPEVWSCMDCMDKAEDGSKLAQIRNRVYLKDYAAYCGIYPWPTAQIQVERADKEALSAELAERAEMWGMAA